MTQTKCDILVFIGRFQPFHIGHKAVLDAALATSGESHRAGRVCQSKSRSFRNPWTFEDRAEMLAKVYPNEVLNSKQLRIRPLNDTMYNDEAWTSSVQRAVDAVIKEDGLEDKKVGLIGHSKDKSSYYLKLFPQWDSVDVKHEVGVFNATDIRKSYFRGAPAIPHDILPPAISEYLKTHMMTDEFKRITAEAAWIKDYKASWANAPFPPTFVTVDNVVVQSGHILLVRRGGHPGKGLLALPGGFVDHDETLLESAIRELREETKLADKHGPFPMGKLKGYLDGQGVFDDPKTQRARLYADPCVSLPIAPAKDLMKVIGIR